MCRIVGRVGDLFHAIGPPLEAIDVDSFIFAVAYIAIL